MTDKIERLIISEHIKQLSLDNMLLTEFISFQEEYGSSYSNLHIDVEYFGYDGGADFYLTGDRPETDEEYQKRSSKILAARAQAKDKKAKKIASEKAEYERLKKKYG